MSLMVSCNMSYKNVYVKIYTNTMKNLKKVQLYYYWVLMNKQWKMYY